MDRKIYLELCQKCAVRPKSEKVIFSGIEYYPLAYQLSFDNRGGNVHTAILQDVKARSIIHCALGSVDGGKNEIAIQPFIEKAAGNG